MNIRYFEHLPKPYLAYPKIIQGLIRKKKSAQQALPELQYVVESLQIDPQHLQDYQEICGFAQDESVPAIYLTVLAQSLQMHMMTQEDFPFAVLGLVHIHNQISQKRKINWHESLSLSCEFAESRPHDKGIEFDFKITAKVADEMVMQGVSTYLSRQKQHAARSMQKKADAVQPEYVLQEQWSVAENTGRRYALISGDFNLIHLHAFTAKAFGFKRAIAHGMWSKARALASLALPDAYHAEVTFKLPLYLPSTVEFMTCQQGQQTDFLIRNAQSKKPHMVGVLQVL